MFLLSLMVPFFGHIYSEKPFDSLAHILKLHFLLLTLFFTFLFFPTSTTTFLYCQKWKFQFSHFFLLAGMWKLRHLLCSRSIIQISSENVTNSTTGSITNDSVDIIKHLKDFEYATLPWTREWVMIQRETRLVENQKRDTEGRKVWKVRSCQW